MNAGQGYTGSDGCCHTNAAAISLSALHVNNDSSSADADSGSRAEGGRKTMKNAKLKECGDPPVGPAHSWAATVEDMLEPVYRFIRARAPAAAVDDLVQETFAAASGAVGEFDGRCPVWNWLTTIARNKIADFYRRSGSRSGLMQALEALDAEGGQLRQSLTSESPLPDEICQRQEFQALTRAALSAVDPVDRECLVARYYEGLSIGELARRLGISQAAANTRLHRARQELRQVLLCLLNDK